MAQDTLLGFPAHTLPFRCGESTSLSTASSMSFLLFHIALNRFAGHISGSADKVLCVHIVGLVDVSIISYLKQNQAVS